MRLCAQQILLGHRLVTERCTLNDGVARIFNDITEEELVAARGVWAELCA